MPSRADWPSLALLRAVISSSSIDGRSAITSSCLCWPPSWSNYQVSLIFTGGGAVSTLAAKAATRTVPIVFVAGDDPVRAGIVATLNRPESNVTGISLYAFDIEAKKLEVLTELTPNTRTIAVLRNPTAPEAEPQANVLKSAAATLRRELHLLSASTRTKSRPPLQFYRDYRWTLCLLSTMSFSGPQWTNHRACTKALRTCDLRFSASCHSGGTDQLRVEPDRCLSASRCIRRTYLERRKARRTAGDATDQV